MPDQRLPELTRSVSGGVALEDPVRPSTDATWDDDSLLVRKRIDELCGIVIQRLAIPFSIPTFDLKLRGLAAGRAHLRHAHLSFNPVFLRENRSHFLLHTVAHEVAHLVAYAVWGPRIKPHGREWKLVMSLFGLKGRATHVYDVSGIKSRRKRHVYQCACTPEILLGPIRHARFQRGVQYICRRCNTPIQHVTGSHN